MIVDGHRHIPSHYENILRNMDDLGIARTVLVGVGVRDLSAITIKDSLFLHSPLLLRLFGTFKARRMVNSSALKRVILDAPINDRVLEAMKAVPDRFLGFTFINPGADNVLDEINRCLDAGMCGIKMALVQFPVDLSGQKMASICDIARRRKVPIFIHQGITKESSDLTAVTARFPDVNFIIAHAGAQYYEQALSLAAARGNVYIDTSSYLVPFVKLHHLCNHVDLNKVIFGSDVPVMSKDASEGLERIQRLEISKEDKSKILGANLMKLLEAP